MVGLGKNMLPTLALDTHYFAERGWLFLNHVTVISDGKPVLDRDLPDVFRIATGPSWEAVTNRSGRSNQAMRADATVYRVHEFMIVFSTDAELAALRRITKSSILTIKFRGTNGEATLPARDANVFRTQIIQGFSIYDLLLRALRDRST